MKKNYVKLMSVSSVFMLGLSALGLVSCGNNETVVEPEPVVPEVVTTFTIANKDELTTEWTVGDDARLLEFDFGDVAVNPQTALNNGKLTVVSSDSNVVSALGLNVAAVGAGTCTVTATYVNDDVSEEEKGTTLTDSFTVTVQEAVVVGESAPVTATVTEFINAEYDGTNAYTSYLVTGTLQGFGSKGTSKSNEDAGKYGNLYLTDGTSSVYIYGCSATNTSLYYDGSVYKFSNPQDFLTNSWTSKLSAGDEVTMVLKRHDYNGTIEGTGYFVNASKLGRVPGTETTIAEAVADSYFDAAYKVYKVSGTIKGFGKDESSLSETADGAAKYGNMFITGEDGTTVQVYGSTASTGAIAWNGSALKFTNPQDFLTNSTTSALKAGDKVEMEVIRCDYKGTIEVTGEITKVN